MAHADQRGSRPSVLLFGAGGQVGTELLALLPEHWQVIAPRSHELDLADANALRRKIQSAQPRWIVNAAAYTAVDRAESEPEQAFAINARAVGIMGEEAKRCGAAVVHYSTDYVFDGEPGAPRREQDPTGPLGVYGFSKLAGEQALSASGAAHFLFRTSWVYSTHGKNFLLTILKLARQKDELRIVADQFGSPTFARNLARLTLHAMRRSEELTRTERLSLGEAVDRLGGLYHACDTGETSWFGFAQEFLRLARRLDQDKQLAALTPITTADYPTPARRPADSRMDCSRLTSTLDFAMPAWQQSVAQVMEELYAADLHFARTSTTAAVR